MERLVGIPLETALNGMPGLEDLRSTSIAGLNDIKCQFAYGTDYWAARQEVINRIGMVEQPAARGHARASRPGARPARSSATSWKGPATRSTSSRRCRTGSSTGPCKTVPGVIDVTGYGGTVKQYQVLLDTRLLRQYDVTLQQVEDAIAQSNANVGGDILTLGSQSHNVRAIGLLGEGVDPLDPANVDQAVRDRGREARRHPGRRRHHAQRHADLRPAGRQGGRSATGPGWAIVGRGATRTTSSRASS